MTPELADLILTTETDPYLQHIVDEIYRIWGSQELVACIANYRARQRENIIVVKRKRGVDTDSDDQV